ncbi:fungal-specific transcription factor domain-containing protein [Rhexocercosporidium sp. MPI-PUGE-AT-0058]|nr:fungal-specific transcription factor domain-containing protein [Rhexocercosporidium sp. MPI-PUGE-AT-0058]
MDNNHPHHRHHSAIRGPSAVVAGTPGPVACHQYACVTCRSRKVKCNRVITGCAECKRAKIHCVYSPRRSRKNQKTQQLIRGVRPLAPVQSAADDGTTRLQIEKLSINPHDDSSHEDHIHELSCQSSTDSWQLSRDGGHGSLSDSASPNSDQLGPATLETLNGSFLFNTQNSKANIRRYHPSPRIMELLWQHYIDNVDILVKILYKPAVEALVLNASKDLGKIDASTEALLFAMYFASVTTMSIEECQEVHGEHRSVLLQRYRYSLEQILAQLGLVTSQDVFVLQALTLLIVCHPKKDGRSTWMLSGMAIRIAQAMGMHRENASSLESIVDTEVRRRIWWTLCSIDNRISEDALLESNVPMTMDTKLPCHINDSDLYTVSTEGTLTPRNTFTEMTVSLVRIEMAELGLKVKFSQYSKSPLSSQEIEVLVREKTQLFESTYVKFFDTSLHLHNVVYLGVRYIISKLWRMVYDPFQGNDPTLVKEKEIRQWLFSSNIEILEISHQLPDGSSKFGWFFRCKYTQWHALAYVLNELCNQTQGPTIDRAWAAVDAVLGNSNDDKESMRLAGLTMSQEIWQQVEKLLKRAQHIRQQAILQAQASHDLNEATSIPQHIQTADANSLLADPFLGSVPDMGEEMNMENWDAWVESFQGDFLLQQGFMEYERDDHSLPLSWW